jgi:hypothetical protein
VAGQVETVRGRRRNTVNLPLAVRSAIAAASSKYCNERLMPGHVVGCSFHKTVVCWSRRLTRLLQAQTARTLRIASSPACAREG